MGLPHPLCPASRKAGRVSLTLLLLTAACDPEPQAPPSEAPPEPARVEAHAPEPPPPPPPWPEAGAALHAPTLNIPEDWRIRRVFIDPGHGVGQNTGNRSALCEQEGDVMMALGTQVAAHLQSTGAFAVRLSRQPGEQVSYSARMQHAAQWEAEAFISLHSDSRGPYRVDADGCYHSDDEIGFSVLYSDEGAMAPQRHTLAQALAEPLRHAGFPPYQGRQYEGLYEGSDGVFVDRHAPSKRIMFLRRPRMPSVIVETHHALDRQAAERWQEAETVRVFSLALASGLIHWLSTPDPEP